MEERMKEMERKEGAAEKTNRVLHLLSEMWPAYLIEVVVIILGISITLVLEEWRDNAKEEKLAAVYRDNLATDIEADERSLQYAIGGTEDILKAGKEIDRLRPRTSGRCRMPSSKQP